MISLTKDQVAMLRENKSLAIVMPLPEQPPEGYRCEGISNDGNVVFANNIHYQDPNYEQLVIKLKYPVGKEVKCKEPWWIRDEYTNMGFIAGKDCPVYYQADGEINNAKNKYKWQPASTMPAEAVRFHTAVTANRVCRAQELTWKDIESLGYDIYTEDYGPPEVNPFVADFNSLFGKPVLRTVDGKRQYVAWAWDIMSWWKMYVEDKNLSSLDGNTQKHIAKGKWKHLDLAVYFNPFVEIFDLNTEEP